MLFAVSFAILAAFLFAVSASLQQHAAREAVRPYERRQARVLANRGLRRTTVFVGLLRLLRRLVRRPLWLFGWFTNLIGFGVQALALHFGSVALVQPVLVTQLLFALPMAAAWQRRRPGTRDWTSSVLICGGLVVFLAVRGVAPVADHADRVKLAWGCIAAAAAVAVLLLGCVGMPPLVRAAMIAVGAGLCFAVSAAMIKLTSDDLLQAGVAATARDWPGYVLAASTLCGLLLEQGAFAAGSLASAIAAMSIANPVASYLLGVFAFGVAPPEGSGPLAGLAGAAVLISLGAVGLAHSPIVRSEAIPDRLAGDRPVYA